MLDRKETDWRAIVLATLVSVFMSAVVGGLWGLSVASVFLAKGMDAVEAVDTTAARISGFLISLVPIVLGTRCLIGLVFRDQKRHCLLFGFLFTGITIPFGIAEQSLAWHDILYYLAIVPTTFLTCQLTQGKQRVR